MKSLYLLLSADDTLLAELLQGRFETVSSLSKVPQDAVVIVLDRELSPSVSDVKQRRLVVITPEVRGIDFRPVELVLELEGAKFTSMIVTGDIREGVPVLSHQGITFCSRIGESVLCLCKILTPILIVNPELVLKEVKLLVDQVRTRLSTSCTRVRETKLDELVLKLRQVVVEERRKHRVSKTLSLLTELAEGKHEVLNSLPAHVLDLLVDYGIVDMSTQSINAEALRKILRKLEKQVYLR